MGMLTLVEAARQTGLATVARAIRSRRFSASSKEDRSEESDLTELAQVHSFAAPSASAAPPANTVTAAVPAVRRRTLHVTDEELRYRIIRAEESLSELKSALEDMRSQRDAWQAMAQAKLLPANRATPSWWQWLRRAG